MKQEEFGPTKLIDDSSIVDSPFKESRKISANRSQSKIHSKTSGQVTMKGNATFNIDNIPFK